MALIAGPTASGKSALAVALAQALGDAEVVNADASQVYADIPLLSARPDAAEMAGIPHRLFGHVDGGSAHNAARWAEEARRTLSHAHAAGKGPILVGGTGLYLDTLLHGIAPVPEIDPAIRETVRAMPVSESYAHLAAEDPDAAARLRPSDTTRVARALEVVRSTGTPLHVWQTRRAGGILGRMPIRAGVVLRPRAELAERASARLDLMLAGGALEEVAALLDQGLPPDRPVLRALGVREITAVLAGEIDVAQAHERILKLTVAYQKRQLTWARGRQSGWTILDPDTPPELDRLALLD